MPCNANFIVSLGQEIAESVRNERNHKSSTAPVSQIGPRNMFFFSPTQCCEKWDKSLTHNQIAELLTRGSQKEWRKNVYTKCSKSFSVSVKGVLDGELSQKRNSEEQQQTQSFHFPMLLVSRWIKSFENAQMLSSSTHFFVLFLKWALKVWLMWLSVTLIMWWLGLP